MTGPDLKPCPFCGRKMDITDDLRHYNHPMSACFGRHIGIAAGDIDRIDLWNRRDPATLAALPEVQALIAAAYEAAAQVVDTCNAEGPYQAIGAACRIRSLTPADATAALAARDAAMIARGRVKGLREAATLLREQGYGTAPKQILARAAEIERESGA